MEYFKWYDFKKNYYGYYIAPYGKREYWGILVNIKVDEDGNKLIKILGLGHESFDSEMKLSDSELFSKYEIIKIIFNKIFSYKSSE